MTVLEEPSLRGRTGVFADRDDAGRWLTPALLLSGLAACTVSSPGDREVDKPVFGSKADSARICDWFGEPPGCDPCELGGWYGDGECDALASHGWFEGQLWWM
jgi:hypothetical protein